MNNFENHMEKLLGALMFGICEATLISIIALTSASNLYIPIYMLIITVTGSAFLAGLASAISVFGIAIGFIALACYLEIAVKKLIKEHELFKAYKREQNMSVENKIKRMFGFSYCEVL